MQKYSDLVLNARNGTPLRRASVTVKTYPGGALATIYSDNGVTPAANPLSTDANGRYSFYAADGRYTIEIAAAGFDGQSLTDVLLEDPVGAEDLDDYQSGSWTPALTFGGAAVGMSGIAAAGRHVKIGRLVHVVFVFVYTTKGSSTGAAAIGGLPFTVDNNGANHFGALSNWESLATPVISIPAFLTANMAQLFKITAADTISARNSLRDTDFANTVTTLNGAFSYLTAE